MECRWPEPPPLPGEVLSQRQKVRQWQVLARGVGEDQLQAVRSHPAVQAIEVRSPSLEEIFVAYVQREEVQTKASGEVPAP